jgi:hypothetical protein
MSWGAQNRFKDAKTPGVGRRVMSRKPKLALCGIQPYALVYPLQRIYWLWQVPAVRRYKRGSAGGASHLPTRVVPSSSADRARQYRARSGLRTKRS